MRYDMFWDSFETCLHGALLEMLKIDINFNNCKTCLRKKQNQLGYMFYKPGAPALPGGLKSYFKGDPDIQIYQLNNSLQYQRGSHARHMHFWSSFEPSRLILKL